MASLDSVVHLTDEVVADFGGMGSQMLIEKLQTKDLSQNEADDLAIEIFTEILLCHENGQLANDGIIQFLSNAINDEEKAAIFCQALDIFPMSESLQSLIDELKKTEVIQAKTFAENVDTSLLTSLEFVPAQSLNRQLNTRKRDMFYTQRKFNLFYEEFEGYAKLVQELFRLLKTPKNLGFVDLALRATESLIGHYQLDPNRVLDVVLDVFSHLIVGNQQFVAKYLRQSRWWPFAPATPFDGIGALNNGGSETASKLLALKFTKAKPDKDLSETLKILIAILIRVGFVSFGSIYKFLRPDDEEMQSLEQLYKKELDEQVFKSNASALALAAPLADDDEDGKTTNGSTKDTTETARDTLSQRLPLNMKFQFLKTFLETGLYWPSVFILTEYPFLVHVDPEVSELMLRMVDQIIEPFYSKTFKDLVLTEALQKPRQQALSNHMAGIKYTNITPAQLYCFKPTAHMQSNKELVYFYSDWMNDLPKVEDFGDLLELSLEYLKFLGTKLCCNLTVFSKLCDILTYSHGESSSSENREIYLNYFRNYIFPAMTGIEDNPVPIAKAFQFLQLYPVEDRFNLYGELYQVLAKNNAHVKINYGKAEKATKDTLKRISKENVKPMMRRLAKISFVNPLPCFLTMLQQIESYDNLNSLVVDTAQYFNEYGWDNMTLAILMRLTSLGRSNIQQDGLHERQWIQSLASFIGQICHKYPKSVDLDTITKYLVKSFHLKESSGLLVFKEILALTGGMKPINNLTTLQIDMINSGQSLEKIVYQTIDDRRFESVEAGSTLANVFLELNVINEVLALLSNLVKVVVSGEEYSHLKVLANRNDDIDTVMHFFCTLIGFFGNENIPNNLESITTLVDKYGVSIPWAFELWRPYLTDTEILGDIGEKFTRGVSSSLFTTFWSLKLFDINFNPDIYDSQVSKLIANDTSLRESLLLAKKDRTTPQEVLKRFVADIRKTEDFKAKIPSEKEAHESHAREVTDALSKHCEAWFSSNLSNELEDESRAFLQECVLPRCVHSSYDAVFSARFLFKLHELGHNQYSIITLLTQVFHSQITFATLFTCTPSEAECLGLFYSEILKILAIWHTEEGFEKLNSSTPLKRNGEQLSFKDYRKFLFDLHSALLLDVSRSLAAEEYMCRRNAITLMKNLLGVYPNVEDHCEAITELIENIVANEEREDLKLSSSALIGHVKSRAKTWVHMWNFFEMEEEEKQQQINKRKALEEEAARIREQKKKKREEEEKRAKEEEEQRLREEEERRKKEEEEERKMIEEEKAEQQREASANALKYEDGGTAPARQTRNEEVSRGRYDQYSRASPRPSTPVHTADKSKDKSSRIKEEKAKTEDVSKQAKSSDKPASNQDLFKNKNRPSAPARSSDRKTSPAKDSDKDLKEKSTSQENARTRFANQKLPSSSDARNAQRKPLPPQQAPRHSRYNHSQQGRRDDRGPKRDSASSKSQSRVDSRSNTATPLPPPATPPPPPPTAPPKRENFDRGDRKREWRGSYRNEKRSRY